MAYRPSFRGGQDYAIIMPMYCQAILFYLLPGVDLRGFAHGIFIFTRLASSTVNIHFMVYDYESIGPIVYRFKPEYLIISMSGTFP